MENKLTVGKVAKAAGVGVETLRFYEREGVLDPPARTASGYRIYDAHTIDRIRFIHRAQGLGFTLREIRELIALDSDPDAECDELRAHAVHKVELIERKIADLEAMKIGLGALLDSCTAGQPIRDCPVMRCLTEVEETC
jgi:Hg(II)-responsive transcriptional regulator